MAGLDPAIHVGRVAKKAVETIGLPAATRTAGE
jgi:hypothetical protein